MPIDNKLPINAVTLPYLEGLYQSAELTPGKKLDPLTPAQIQQARSAKALGDLPTTTTYQGDTIPDRRALAISLTHAAVKLGLDKSFSLSASDSGYALQTQIAALRRDILEHYGALTKATPGKTLLEWTPAEVALAKASGVKPGEISKALTVEYLALLTKGELDQAKEYRARFSAELIAPTGAVERDALRVFADRLSWQHPIRTEKDLEVLEQLIAAEALAAERKPDILEQALLNAVKSADAEVIARLKPLVNMETINLDALSNAYAEGTKTLLDRFIKTRSDADFEEVAARIKIPDSTHSYRYMEAFEALVREGSFTDAKRVDDAWFKAAEGHESTVQMWSSHRHSALGNALRAGISAVTERWVQAFGQGDLAAANKARSELREIALPMMEDNVYDKKVVLARLATTVGYHPLLGDATYQERLELLQKFSEQISWASYLPPAKPILLPHGSTDLAPALRDHEGKLGYTTPELTALTSEILRRAPIQLESAEKELSAILKDILLEAKKKPDNDALKTLKGTPRADLRAALIELRSLIKPMASIELPQL